MSVPVIAIDGPSASGKGAVAHLVADALGFHCLESGALYRLVALAGPQDPERTAKDMDVAFRDRRIFLSGQDVTDKLRAEEVGVKASAIAQRPGLRQTLLHRQRAFRQPPGLVAEGRDMGSVVFPDAVLKVFLTAAAEVRAQRRYKQLIDKGIDANLHALSRDLEQRDARDAARKVAPLAPAPDALLLDTSEKTLDEVVGVILGWCRERELGGRRA
ncbi:MAG: (d)CMP kinase [Betaproteobacteria bacterium]|nr:(d)CMP kinase [Betaproteobacteria bacterium]MDH5222523.1 (d)CMP kinase [Betaproteobacteria bacterium]MDH5351616.1 (d)CMP kinase [Betaproteobacteria bacterium]